MAQTLVRDIMDSDPATVRDDATVEEVIRLLRDNELPGVPVVNEAGRCVDVLGALAAAAGD